MDGGSGKKLPGRQIIVYRVSTFRGGVVVLARISAAKVLRCCATEPMQGSVGVGPFPAARSPPPPSSASGDASEGAY
jgi:hypothetical protein